jgi:uncharacterized circularly permuted ATP-grasp superfamily protein
MLGRQLQSQLKLALKSLPQKTDNTSVVVLSPVLSNSGLFDLSSQLASNFVNLLTGECKT